MSFKRVLGFVFVSIVLLVSGFYFLASLIVLFSDHASGGDRITGFFGAILAGMIFGATALLAWWKRKTRAGLQRLKQELGFTPQQDVFHVKFDLANRLVSAPPYKVAIPFDDVLRVGMDWSSRSKPNPLGGSMNQREAVLGIYTKREDVGVWWIKLPVSQQAAQEAHFKISRILGFEED